MNLVAALTVAVLAGAGAMLLIRRDLLRLLAGTMQLSNAAILFVMLSAPAPAEAPVHPIPEGTSVSDPVVQALALTAVVINLGISALLLAFARQAYRATGAIDLSTVSPSESP